MRSSLPEIEHLSFEEALDQLDKIMRWLETHDATIEETVRAFERGSRLRQHCESLLSEAEDRIEGLATETPNRPDSRRAPRRRRDRTPDTA